MPDVRKSALRLKGGAASEFRWVSQPPACSTDPFFRPETVRHGRADSLTVLELTADNVEDVLASSPFPEQLRHVNPLAWYVARSAYQGVWHPVGLATADGAVVGFAEWAYDESDGTYSLGGIIIDHRQQCRGLARATVNSSTMSS